METAKEILGQDTESLEKKIYDMENLIGLGISMSSNLHFESLVESILFSCIGQMVIEKVVILLQEDLDSGGFYVHMSKGFPAEASGRSVLINENSALLKYFRVNPLPVLWKDLEYLPRDEAYKNIEALEPALMVPMKSKDSLNGMIIMGEKLTGAGYNENDRAFMKDLARFAAIAVENSRLYQMAILDRMTRLYIHHYFQERLHEEIKRSERTRTPLSLIMFDIDHFKKFNDTYGHQQGDSVLKETAALLKKNIRNFDIAARYGGEEFAVILPQTALPDAVDIAVRIRRKIEAYRFAGDGQSGDLSVTVSLGVAEYDKALDRGREHLIKRADVALYGAKRKGRNRVAAHRGGKNNPGLQP